MEKWNERTILLLGEERVAKFAKTEVLIVGLGGVGAFVAEFLVRAGIGNMAICDFDVVRPSNRNRQLAALVSTEETLKTDVMAKRLADINPEIKITTLPLKFDEENEEKILFKKFDYVVDAIDTLSPKTYLIAACLAKNIPIISSMGAGEKCDPSLVQTADIEDSYNCPLARAVRKKLHKLGFYDGFKVVFSPEPRFNRERKKNAGAPNGTISYMPAIFGVHCAAAVLRNIGFTV
jgi:tRNA A37 threonylcarbamoyladenosine dehydratase